MPKRLDRDPRAILKAYLVDSPAGLFLLEKTGKIAEKALFPRNPKDAAVKLNEVRGDNCPPNSLNSPTACLRPAWKSSR